MIAGAIGFAHSLILQSDLEQNGSKHAPGSGCPRISALGQDDPFVPPKLNACSRLGQRTSAGTRGNERDAPKPDIKAEPTTPPLNTHSGYALLFDYLIGAGEHRGRYFDPKRPCRGKIDE